MTDPTNLNEVRAETKGDPRLWTPLDCLKALVRDLESGECRAIDGVYVAMVRRHEDGTPKAFPYYLAGMLAIEARGVLAQHLHDICNSFEQA